MLSHLTSNATHRAAWGRHATALAPASGLSPLRHDVTVLASFLASLDPNVLAASTITTLAQQDVLPDSSAGASPRGGGPAQASPWLDATTDEAGGAGEGPGVKSEGSEGAGASVAQAAALAPKDEGPGAAGAGSPVAAPVSVKAPPSPVPGPGKAQVGRSTRVPLARGLWQ